MTWINATAYPRYQVSLQQSYTTTSLALRVWRSELALSQECTEFNLDPGLKTHGGARVEGRVHCENTETIYPLSGRYGTF